MLEPDEGKLSRPVLRRGGGSNPTSLAGTRWLAYAGLLTTPGLALLFEKTALVPIIATATLLGIAAAYWSLT